MNWATLLGRETLEVICLVDIEQTHDSFHAHAVPDGIDIRPGDRVTVHDVPTDVAFGERIECVRRATVVRASLAERTWTRMSGLFGLTELYEVGFAPKEGT